jgi:hypothetical protein
MGAVIINQAAILSPIWSSSGEKRSKPTKELVYTIEW